MKAPEISSSVFFTPIFKGLYLLKKGGHAPPFATRSESAWLIPRGRALNALRIPCGFLRRYKGFSIGTTLIEVLIALFVLAVLLTPIMLVFSSGSRGIKITSEELIAHTAAIELLEQLMSIPYRFLPVKNFSASQIKDEEFLDSTNPWKFHISENPEITREAKISEVKKFGKVRFKKIEVVIVLAPKDGRTRPQKVVLKSLMANEEN